MVSDQSCSAEEEVVNRILIFSLHVCLLHVISPLPLQSRGSTELQEDIIPNMQLVYNIIMRMLESDRRNQKPLTGVEPESIRKYITETQFNCLPGLA